MAPYVTPGSWYSQLPAFGWFDKEDRPGSNALGVPDYQQGIALPTRAGLGKWFNVTPPGGGLPFPMQQTDIGPAARTGRGVDISAAAAHQMGYTPQTFPTDAGFKIEPRDEPRGLGSPAGLPVQAGDLPDNATADAYASGPSSAPARKSMPTSLMDMFQPRDMATNQPQGFGDALQQRSNSLVGLGLGLLTPYRPWAGESPYANALQGYMGGAQADSAAAYRQAQLAHTQRQEDFQRSQAAQAQSNWQKEFGLKGAPTWGKIGEDQFGQAQYGFIDPRKGTVTGYSPPVAAGDQPAPGRQSTVDAILEGRMAPPTSFAASKPYWQGILAQAAEKEPGFDLTQWGTRFATRKDFGSGVAARNATALDTVTGHLETLMDKSKALDNYSFPMVNQVKNYLGVQAGQPQVTEFNLARNAVSDELAKVFRSTGMSDAEIRAWKTNLDAAGSPDQLKGAVKTAIELVDSRRDALKEQYQRGMGKEPPELLSAKGQKSLERVRNWASGGKDEAPTARPPSTGLEGMSKKEIQQELIRRGVLSGNSL